MATTTNLYDVNNTVYQVDISKGVRKGVVSAVDIAMRPSGIPLGYVTTITYVVHLTETSQKLDDVTEDTLFDDLDAALAAYKVMIEA